MRTTASLDVVVVNTGVANVRAITNMLRRLHAQAEISDQPERLRKADCLILPGVGSYDAAVKRIQERGLWEVLDDKVSAGTPIMGICLGMQLMAEGSDEGERPGFGWFRGKFKRFRSDDGGETKLRVPHMGWNLIEDIGDRPLYADMDGEARFYFDHSYYFIPEKTEEWCGATRYGVRFASGIMRDNLYGLQFHPEKSHRFGLQLFKNFLQLVGK